MSVQPAELVRPLLGIQAQAWVSEHRSWAQSAPAWCVVTRRYPAGKGTLARSLRSVWKFSRGPIKVRPHLGHHAQQHKRNHNAEGDPEAAMGANCPHTLLDAAQLGAHPLAPATGGADLDNDGRLGITDTVDELHQPGTGSTDSFRPSSSSIPAYRLRGQAGRRMARTRPGRILGDQGRLHRHDRHPSENSSLYARWR